MRSLIFLKSALTAAVTGVLLACGGGGSGDGAGPLPVNGQVTNTVSPTGSAVVAVSGQRVTIVSEATANFDVLLSHKWSITQVSGPAGTMAPSIVDTDCAGAVVVPGAQYSPGSIGRHGSSTCATQVVIPAETATSNWLVQNVARSTTGSASAGFTLAVMAPAKVDSGFSLNISSFPQVSIVNQPASLTASYGVGADTLQDGAVRYAWSQVSGPAVPLAGSDTATMTFIPRTPADYVFKIRISATLNGKNEYREGTLVAAVGAVPPPPATFNVSAGNIQSSLVGTPVNLQGSTGGTVPASELSYLWTPVSGPNTVLFGDTNLSAQFLPATPGDYVFELRVTQSGATPVVKTSRVLVVVYPSPLQPYFGVSAGDSQMVGPAPVVVTLNGSVVVNDLSPTKVSYLWTQLSGPAATLANNTSLKASFGAMESGLYVFELAATSGSDTKRVTTSVLVRGASFNVSAGAIQSRLVNTSVTLQGTAEGANATSLTNYQWTQVSGPAATLFGADTLTPQFLPTVAGDYVFELSGTQFGDFPVVKTSRVLVVVYATPTSPFFGVTAGDSQVIAATPSAVTLKGEVVVNDVSPLAVTYLWTQKSGPAVTLANSANLVSSFVATVAGTYEFDLAATQGGVTKHTSTTVLVK